MPSATVQGPYASINTIFDPPKFSLDTTFKHGVVPRNVGQLHVTNANYLHMSHFLC
jgi:hypothetical protein